MLGFLRGAGDQPALIHTSEILPHEESNAIHGARDLAVLKARRYYTLKRFFVKGKFTRISKGGRRHRVNAPNPTFTLARKWRGTVHHRLLQIAPLAIFATFAGKKLLSARGIEVQSFRSADYDLLFPGIARCNRLGLRAHVPLRSLDQGGGQTLRDGTHPTEKFEILEFFGTKGRCLAPFLPEPVSALNPVLLLVRVVPLRFQRSCLHASQVVGNLDLWFQETDQSLARQN